ncbi:unnamed protein product [Effrenium voratum]|nr:unnamed protein product [Effrenium voratum]
MLEARMAMSQTATSAFAGASGAGSAYTTGMPKRKQASVVEMLEYVKSLNIDPIREADMLWIAEEAFNAPLPPGWTEHQDEQGRAYFHNASSGESTWKHPMDDLFREIVDYQRRVVEVGGFWQVEDEIAEQEENIRKDLADWMELFAEDGEKFFYNRHTEESRFDDPRMAVYHVLYARIKMVARMKERFPILARQPRPEEPTEAEKDLRRRKEEEKEHYLSCLLRIQTWGRVLLAKRRLAVAREQAIVQKGPQPLRGMLRLRMERIGPSGSKELVLSQTTPAKRHRAATKIQVLDHPACRHPTGEYGHDVSRAEDGKEGKDVKDVVHDEVFASLGLASDATMTPQDGKVMLGGVFAGGAKKEEAT